MRPVLHSRLLLALIVMFISAGLVETAEQHASTRYVKAVADRAIAQAHATDNRSKVLALRDYLRAHVTWHGAAYSNRRYLRDAADETLRSGKGYCGEVSRAFICMARIEGISAERLNLYGSDPHTVAMAELRPGEEVVVDCQSPPHIKDLETLDHVIARPEYDDYSTLNLRRAGLDWLVTRVKIRMGLLTYWLENPHAMLAALWFSLAGGMALIAVGAMALRPVVRRFLIRRGWAHLSTLQDAGVDLKPIQDRQPRTRRSGRINDEGERVFAAGVG